jgi:hypothetical protein
MLDRHAISRVYVYSGRVDGMYKYQETSAGTMLDGHDG